MTPIIGRLISSDVRAFQFACFASNGNSSLPEMGDMILARIEPEIDTYAVVTNISWQADALVSQLARMPEINGAVLADNQLQRTAPVLDGLVVGYRDTRIIHMLPPRTPLSLERVVRCTPEQIVEFTSHAMIYMRLLLDARDSISLPDVITAHLNRTHDMHCLAGNPQWILGAVDYLSDLLLDDYSLLVAVMETLGQKIPDYFFGKGS